MTVNVTVTTRPSEEELAQQTFDPNGDNDNPFSGQDQQQQQPDGTLEKSLGVAGITLTPQIARQLGAPDGTAGVVVTGVDASSDAGAKGLQRGDIILSANYRDVHTPTDLQTVVKAAKADGREAVLLRVLRRGQPAIYVPIRLR